MKGRPLLINASNYGYGGNAVIEYLKEFLNVSNHKKYLYYLVGFMLKLSSIC